MIDTSKLKDGQKVKAIVCIKTRGREWNFSGKMDYLIDGKFREYTYRGSDDKFTLINSISQLYEYKKWWLRKNELTLLKHTNIGIFQIL